jgi:hypothetical protein
MYRNHININFIISFFSHNMLIIKIVSFCVAFIRYCCVDKYKIIL